MEVHVIRLREEGQAVPRWQLSYRKNVYGELRLEESRNEYLSRFLQTAHLFDFRLKTIEVLAPLLAAAVLWIKLDSMAITGFEHSAGIDYAQTWLVTLPDMPKDGPGMVCPYPPSWLLTRWRA